MMHHGTLEPRSPGGASSVKRSHNLVAEEKVQTGSTCGQQEAELGPTDEGFADAKKVCTQLQIPQHK
ncbi:uncharacterized protein ACA1_044400 [Acanthamoeba castellanii str. Neff]|uniref:Uncharacterized protein n=1 Tax=Acanthamoeba castellanii (strain ATCC 30010 / Neff) TaxID=1257118 RepID=L8H253_ACACF|nr:uncharacterized protein ACA1_044400 [Acanthamoeba castellanii str. Neff]ELR18461.1 hypothetical protein ACA1_044400 [Acanthamoeba castellanii str. Neff]